MERNDVSVSNYMLGFTLHIIYILVFLLSSSLMQAVAVIKGLLDKLRGSVKELEAEESSDGILQHYENTLAHVMHTKATDSSMYPDVEV